MPPPHQHGRARCLLAGHGLDDGRPVGRLAVRDGVVGQGRGVDLLGLGVRYGHRSPWVLQDVTLTLPAGALVEVAGRNGAGESSLLRVLAGVLAPAAGAVLARPGVVGWVPERFPTAQAMRTGEYLRAQARVRGLSSGVERAVQREAGRWGLGPLLEFPLAQLSKGSAQKVGLAQALLVAPGLLVLDEPWSGLDAAARAAVPEVVRQVVAAGGSVAVADHQQQVAALAPDVCWLVEGGAVTDVPVRPAQPPGSRRVVVEVELDEGQAPDVLDELRRRGLAPRVR